MPCHAHAMRARCLPDSLPPLRLHTHSWAGVLSLLAGPAANIVDMLRTLPYHAPSTPLLAYRHLSASVVRPVFALASCESACVVHREGLLPVEAPSFLLPARGAGDVFTWLLPRRANTATSPAPAAD